MWPIKTEENLLLQLDYYNKYGGCSDENNGPLRNRSLHSTVRFDRNDKGRSDWMKIKKKKETVGLFDESALASNSRKNIFFLKFYKTKQTLHKCVHVE